MSAHKRLFRSRLLQSHEAFVENRRDEVQEYTELLPLDRVTRRSGGSARLGHRHGELAARQETRGLTVHGNQIRFGQNARQPIVPQGTQGEFDARRGKDRERRGVADR
jgi:hypothetical protein